MFSMPPATTILVSPNAIDCTACITVFIPEAHTLLTVVQGTVSGIPAYIAACLAGACPVPACTTLPISTSSTKFGSRFILSNAPLIAIAPNLGGGKFKYEFQKGKPWQFENLYAPFDFSIKKSDKELALERHEIEKNQLQYFRYNQGIVDDVLVKYSSVFDKKVAASQLREATKKQLKNSGKIILDSIYKNGILNSTQNQINGTTLFLVKNNKARKVNTSEFYGLNDINRLIRSVLGARGFTSYAREFEALFFDIITPNVAFDETLSKKSREDALSKISYTRGAVDEGKLIIAKGEVVEGENLKVLQSLRSEYESELWTASNYYYILIGYTVLVALVLMMLFLFIKKYRKEVYNNNTKITFIFFNILLLVFITTMVVKYNDALVFVVPLCILPLILKTFFDARLGLFVHVLTVLILGFVVPNSFEYIFLQIIAGIVTILTVSELYKRANLFVSVGQITLIYSIAYLAFHVIHEGNLGNIGWFTLGLFFLNGMITLFVQPLIYIYEKLFGLVSDVSLLELSDTNSKLLKELSNKAPGTFNHSLQVANLAEAAANKIGANAMLVRVGALYHDIGKMNNPTYFSENQKDLETEVNEDNFRYPGPLPYSKETAILMMADSVEAASKSLKDPTFLVIDEFVDKIISGQMNANQFLNANITFKEIEMIKKVFKQKLTNIYHLRVEYPE